MKITIDTQADSHNEIKKAIMLLNHIVGTTKKVENIENVETINNFNYDYNDDYNDNENIPSQPEIEPARNNEEVNSAPLMTMFGNTNNNNENNNDSDFNSIRSQLKETRKSEFSGVDKSTAKEEPKPTPDTPPDFSSFLNLTNKEEEDKENKEEPDQESGIEIF